MGHWVWQVAAEEWVTKWGPGGQLWDKRDMGSGVPLSVVRRGLLERATQRGGNRIIRGLGKGAADGTAGVGGVFGVAELQGL